MAEKNKGDKSFKRGKSFAPKNSATQPEYVLTHIFLHLSKIWQTKKKEFCVNYINFSIFLENRIQDFNNVYVNQTITINIKNRCFYIRLLHLKNILMMRVNRMQLVLFKNIIQRE